MIDKKTAALLFAHSFKLVDKEGNEYSIASITRNDTLSLFVDNESDWKPITSSQIGTDFFILRHDIKMLTETITHEGREVIPIVELAKISLPRHEWYYNRDEDNCFSKYGDYYCFGLSSVTKDFWLETEDGGFIPADNQLQLFDTLHNFHFLPQLSDNLCKPIKS